MRLTNTQLIQAAKDSVIDDTSVSFTGLTNTEAFLKQQINNTVKDLFTLLKEYKLQPPPYTESTVASQIYYKFRPGVSKLESLTIALGTHTPPLKIVRSQEEWDRMQQLPITSGFPTHVFPRRDDYGIYPTPQGVYTMTLACNWMPVNMTADDYVVGTVAVTTGDETVTMTTGTIATTDVGKWFAITDANGVPSQNFYRILSRTDSTHFELDRKVIEATASGQTFLIGESPEIPEELHEFIPYRVASTYYALRRKDRAQARLLLNFYYTGDFENDSRKGNIRGGILAVLKDLKERGRSNSQVVEMGNGSSINFFRDGIWGLTLEAAS